jgi:hypothetical protein
MTLFTTIFIIIFALGTLTNFLQGYNSICIIKNLTGFDCPGCGLTRSILHFTHADISRSLDLNILGIPLFILFVIYMIKPAIIMNTLSYLDRNLGGQATKSKFIQFLILIFLVLLLNWDRLV